MATAEALTPSELCDALLGTFDGSLEHLLIIGAAVVNGSECVVRVAPAEYTDHRFEIGSITKTMTATALSSLVLEGNVALDDHIGRWLDAGPNADITIGQLATHTSGLPRLAPNHSDHKIDLADPYAAYGPDEAEAGLRAATRGETNRSYSNFGFQLLGLLLERVTGESYGDLVRQRLWGPLGMDSTSVAGEQEPIVQGYRGAEPVPPWHALLPGLGSVTSTIADMTAYLRAAISPPDGALGDAMRHAIEHQFAWVVTSDGRVWHNGGTAGARSMLTAVPADARGAVGLTNAGELDELDDAVRLAALGRDPRAALPVPIGNEFDDAIAAVLADLVAKDWHALRARMTESMRESLTAERLDEAWTAVMGERGDLQSSRNKSVVRASGAVRADVELTFAAAEGRVRAVFNDDKVLVGIQIA